MIRDRLVVGIRDSALSERLQLDPELTLDKAKKMVQQKEAVKDQQTVLKGDTNLDALRGHSTNVDYSSHHGSHFYPLEGIAINSVCDAVNLHIHVTNLQPAMQHATDATVKGTIVHSVCQKQSLLLFKKTWLSNKTALSLKNQ